VNGRDRVADFGVLPRPPEVASLLSTARNSPKPKEVGFWGLRVAGEAWEGEGGCGEHKGGG
jgi:hypothetical protein